MGPRRGSRVANSWWHRFQIKRRGKRDGRSRIPGVDQDESSLYERELLSLGQQILEYTRDRYSKRLQELEGKREAAIQLLRKCVTEFKAEAETYRTKKAQLGRDVTIHFPRLWYGIFIVVIVIGETALNAQAFEVFQKPLPLTLLMAFAVGLSIPLTAHFIGIWIKQWPPPRWLTAIKVAIAMAIGVACISGINIARSEYLRLIEVDVAAHEALLQRAFFLINLFVFTTAILMSIFSHDSDQELENLHTRTSRLDGACRGTVARIMEYGGSIDALRLAEDSESNLVHAIFEELVFLYRGENQRARPGAECPKSFSVSPKFPQVKPMKELQEMTPEKEVKTIAAEWTSIQKEAIKAS